MCAPVPAQGGVLVEGAPTVLALIGFLPSVNPAVHSQVCTVAEALATLGTLVGLVACVDTLMLHQGGVLAEGLATLSAYIWPLTCVDAPVHSEVCIVIEGLPTVCALVGLLQYWTAYELHTWNCLAGGCVAATTVTWLFSRGACELTH